MRPLQRTSPLTVLVFAVVGAVIGLIVQFVRSSRGLAPFVPPTSLAATLVVVAAVLIVLAVILHRAVKPADDEPRPQRKPVNPFHAVRLLAGARAGQFAGSLFGGFGAGLALQLLTRSVMPPAHTWFPMLLVLGSGIALAVCGMIAEWLCRVPPSGPDTGSEGGGEPGGTDPGAASERPA